ncbi:MAG TPA: ABC transporter permease [Clostridiales bacterium]|nr:ABC transporter permease [Clostridiales bacterium]
MKKSGLLKLLDRFEGVLRRCGIDYRTLRLILGIRLIMDSRRVPTVLANNRDVRENSNYFRRSLFLYAFMGLFAGLIVLLPMSAYLKFNMTTGIIIFLLMSTMISDFSSVLLDVREKNILLSRPVDPKTLNAAKVIHIIYYLFHIAGALAGPALLIGTMRYGVVFFGVFLLELILICGFVVFFTSILYTSILVFFDGEKLKDMINYFQIVLSVALLIFYQLIGRIFNITDIMPTVSPAWWHYLMPTAWFAAPFSLFLEGDMSTYYLSLSIIALVMPVISLILYVRVVAPGFEKNLQKLNNNSAGKGSFSSLRKRFQQGLAKLICRTDQERLFYLFAQNVTGNERTLKLKVYPSLAFAAVMPFIILIGAFSGGTSPADSLRGIKEGSYYFGLYLTVVIIGSMILMISKSEDYKGAWIYKALPLESPVPVFRGAVKSYLIRFIIPVYLFPGVIFVLIMGARVIPDIILTFFNLIIVLMLIFRMSKKELPFCRDFQHTQDGNTAGIVFLSFFISALLAGIHFLLSLATPFGVYANIAVSALISTLLWRSSFRISWENVVDW